MANKTMHALIAAGAAAWAGGAVSADLIYQNADDRPDISFRTIGFEDVAPGSAIRTLDFGGNISAIVTTERNISNQVFEQTDGFGAVQAEGDRFWKLAGGRTTIDFGSTRLGAFEFMYSDLEWTTLELDFGDAGSTTLRDSNSRDPKLYGFVAPPGQDFSKVTLTWNGKQNDGIGFDSVGVAAIPSPGSIGLLAAGGLIAVGRRRR